MKISSVMIYPRCPIKQHGLASVVPTNLDSQHIRKIMENHTEIDFDYLSLLISQNTDILHMSLFNYYMAKGKKRSTGVKNPHLKRNERKQHVEKKYN